MSDPLLSSSARDPYRDLFERTADAILILEGENFVDCNEACVAMFGFESRADVLQAHPSEISPPRQPDGRDSFEKANEMIALAMEHGNHRFEWDHMRASGEVFPVEVNLTLVRSPGEVRLHAVIRDVTERKQLEERLRHSQKMEAIGQLTGGIAHDFNNLLVAVIGHSELLADLLQDQPGACEHVHEISKAGMRAADLVHQLLAFGRKQQLQPVPLDLNLLVTDLRRLLEHLVGEDVTITIDVADDPVVILADRTQVEQVLLNLASNARDAMQDGGRITVRTRRVHLPEGGGASDHDLPEGEYALLSMTDTGCGMDTETSSRAFEPFYTTKAVGRGTGLGLATVYGIVRQSGGSVSMDTGVAAGTTVSIHLPLSEATVPASGPDAGRLPIPGGLETILVAEDEPMVAALVIQALRSKGYDVLSAADGEEALELYRRNSDRIALVLTDVIMPKLSGPQLVASLRELGEDPVFLFMSGYTGQRLERFEELVQEVDVLEKPFDVRELLRRVRTVLDRHTG